MKLSSLPLADPVPAAPSVLSKPASKKGLNRSEVVAFTERGIKGSIDDRQKSQVVSANGRQQGAWGIFSSTFLTIFLAEIGDKTQLATLLMSAESHAPWVVFSGAAVALVATSLLGVLIGRWLRQRLAPKTLETAAGALLLLISVMLLWDVVQLGG